MSLDDFGNDWLKSGLPVYHGAGPKAKGVVRAAIDKLGGPDNFRRETTTLADGTQVVVQTKGTMPPQVFIHPTPHVAKASAEWGGFVFGNVLSVDSGDSTVYGTEAIQALLKNKLPRGQHDGIVQIWGYDAQGKNKTTSVVAYTGDEDAPESGTVVATHPFPKSHIAIGEKLPAKLVDGKVYVGNFFHGQVADAISDASTLFRIMENDPDLSDGEIRNYALMHGGGGNYGWTNEYRYTDTISLYCHGIYVAPDGTRYAVSCKLGNVVGALWAETAHADLIVEVKMDTPTFDGSEREVKQILSVTVDSPPRRIEVFDSYTSTYFDPGRFQQIASVTPSPSGKKLCVTIQANQGARVDSIWEVELSAGSATALPAAAATLVAGFVPSVMTVVDTGPVLGQLLTFPSELTNHTYIPGVVTIDEYTRTAAVVDTKKTAYSNEEWFRYYLVERRECNRLLGASYGDGETLEVFRAIFTADGDWDFTPTRSYSGSTIKTITKYYLQDPIVTGGDIVLTGVPTDTKDFTEAGYFQSILLQPLTRTRLVASFAITKNDVAVYSANVLYEWNARIATVTFSSLGDPSSISITETTANASSEAPAGESAPKYVFDDLAHIIVGPVNEARMDGYEFSTRGITHASSYVFTVGLCEDGKSRSLDFDGGIHETNYAWNAYNPVTKEYSNTPGVNWR